MGFVKKNHAPDPRRVWLDEKDCVRLTRTEFEALRYMLGAVNYLAKAKDVLQGGPCLKRVPMGTPACGLPWAG